MRSIILLDAANVAIRNIGVHRAVSFIVEGSGVSVLDSDDVLHAANMDMCVPSIVRLNAPRAKCYSHLFSPIRWSKSGVMRRDNWECAYCGEHAGTIDHVHPKSKGGRNEWLNTVACCSKCNSKKGDSLLENTDLELRFKPFTPTRHDLIILDETQRSFFKEAGMPMERKRVAG